MQAEVSVVVVVVVAQQVLHGALQQAVVKVLLQWNLTHRFTRYVEKYLCGIGDNEILPVSLPLWPKMKMYFVRNVKMVVLYLHSFFF